MKPIVRWTIGAVNQEGIDSLSLSVRNWVKLYGDTFDMFICHNWLTANQTNLVSQMGPTLIDQSHHLKSLPYTPFKTTWKLYPPRISTQSHELFIDNDLILYKKSKYIDRFFSSDSGFIITSAYKRFYGQYKELVPGHLTINSGLFGVPPGYDLAAEINMFVRLYPSLGWREHCDDEGVLACLFARRDLTVMPMDEIAVCNPSLSFAPYKLGASGVHFVGMNQGFTDYWHRYRREAR